MKYYPKIKNTLLKFSFSVFFVAVAPSLFGQSYDEGVKLFFHRNYQKAEGVFRSITMQDPNHEKAHYFLAMSLIKLDRFDDAAKVCKDAIQNNKKFSRSGLLLAGEGHATLLRGDSMGARVIFEEAITMSKGKEPDVLTAVGFANLESKGNAKYAVEVLTQATEAKKFVDSKTYLFLGYAYKQLLDGSRSVQNFNKASAMNPKEAEAYYQVGKIFATQQNEEIFMQNYHSAIKADPDFFPTYFELAMHYFTKQNVDSTRKYLNIYSQKSQEAGEDPTLIKTHNAALLFVDKKYDQSLDLLNSINPNTSNPTGRFVERRILRLKSLNYDAKKDFAHAISTMQSYIEKTETSKDGLEFTDMFLFLSILLGSDDTSLKSQLFKSAVEKTLKLKEEENVRNVMINKIEQLCEKMNYAEGIADLRVKKLSLSPNPASADYFNAGYAYVKAGRNEEAIPYLKEYVKMEPNEPYGHFWLGQAYVTVDSTMSLSRTSFDKFISLTANKTNEYKSGLVSASTFMAMYFTKNKNYDEAITWWDKVLVYEPGNATATKVKAQLLDYQKKVSDYKIRQAEYERRKKEMTAE